MKYRKKSDDLYEAFKWEDDFIKDDYPEWFYTAFIDRDLYIKKVQGDGFDLMLATPSRMVKVLIGNYIVYNMNTGKIDVVEFPEFESWYVEKEA